MTSEKRYRNIQVGVRLSPAEFEAIKQQAERRGWSVSQFMRSRSLRGLTVEVVAASEEQVTKAVNQ